MSEEQDDRVIASGWADSERAVKEASAGRFLKWEDGETKLVCICGEPTVQKREFQGELRTRIMIQCYAEDSLKTWDMSPTVYCSVLEERELCSGAFEDALFKVRRSGTGKMTVYRLRYERQLSADEISARNVAMNGADAPF